MEHSVIVENGSATVHGDKVGVFTKEITTQ